MVGGGAWAARSMLPQRGGRCRPAASSASSSATMTRRSHAPAPSQIRRAGDDAAPMAFTLLLHRRGPAAAQLADPMAEDGRPDVNIDTAKERALHQVILTEARKPGVAATEREREAIEIILQVVDHA